MCDERKKKPKKPECELIDGAQARMNTEDCQSDDDRPCIKMPTPPKVNKNCPSFDTCPEKPACAPKRDKDKDKDNDKDKKGKRKKKSA